MNNSFPRLVDGMIQALRREVIPHTAGEFARGQAFGVIYMLESLKRRAAWSNGFLGEQLLALGELERDLQALRALRADAPVPTGPWTVGLPAAADLERERDEGDARVCRLLDWLADHRSGLPAEVASEVDEALARYVRRQLRWELTTSARPMFEEISSGADANA